MMKKKQPQNNIETGGSGSTPNTAVEHEFAADLARINALHEVPERDPAQVRMGRQAFLAEARTLHPAVSVRSKRRLMGWTRIFKKERSPMFTFARIVLLVAIAFGTTGVTAYAAQESLPDQALYSVKTWIEDIRLGITSGPQADFDLLLGFVQERIEEMESLASEGRPITNRVTTRLSQQLQLMLQLAAEMDNPALLRSMEQVQERSQNQLQTLEQLRVNAPEDAEALGLATQAMNNIRNTAEGAIEDPLTFRMRQGTHRPDNAPEAPENEPSNGNGQDPIDGQGQGPQDPGQPGPGNSMGPGKK